jgi:Uma2 family endonuclease
MCESRNPKGLTLGTPALDPRKLWYAAQMTTQSKRRRMTVAEFIALATAQHAREPDAAVQCGVTFDPNSMILEAPLLVVEIASPSSERDDTGEKLVEYLSVPSIHHYLIVNPAKKVVIHHARAQGGDISTRIVSSGVIELTPPGMKVPVAELLPEIG